MRKLPGVIKVLIPIFLLLSGLGYGGYVYYGYAKGRVEYAALLDDYTRPYGENKEAVPAAVLPKEDVRDETEDEPMTETTIWKPLAASLPEDAPERLLVDFEELKQKNGDVKAWIHVPSVSISYPVLQSDDNDYYLHRDINRDYLYAGSVFMDADNNPAFYNYNTIIYGHNMRDGSMFAKLKDFGSKEVYDTCPYFWIFTPDADYLYEICSVHLASPGSSTFTLRFSDYEEYRHWLEEMLGKSVIQTGIKLESQDRIVTLSTCTESSSVRMTVQGKLIWKEVRN